VTVTESKYLYDSVSKAESEVDIVIEGEFDGEPMVISVEVTEHSRKAEPNWVRSMIDKHRGMPTNLLLLVSKSGFSATALRRVEAEAGNVQALTPEIIRVNGETAVKRLFVDTINYNPQGCKVHVRLDSNQQGTLTGEPLTDIYAADGTLLGPLAYLAQDTVNLDAIRKILLFKAHEHPEKSQVKAFLIGVPMPQLGYHIKRADTDELYLIEELEIWGDFAVSHSEVPLTFTRLGNRIYGAAEAPFVGRPAVWVGTTDTVIQTTKISWRITDKPPYPIPPAQTRPIHFSGLLNLAPSEASRDGGTSGDVITPPA
jgi:hypothetical protein